MKSFLSSLISPVTTDEFLASYEANKPFFLKTTSEQIAPISGLPFLASLDALLNCWPSVIEVHLPDLQDEASSIETTAGDARKLFGNGMGLLFKNVQMLSPLLESALDQLRVDLGLSALTYNRCMVYATPEGKGTAAHFDQNLNFVLQLQGTKKWWIAPNEHVVNPLSRHTMGQPLDPELSSYASASMPKQMPENAQSFELVPGSLLFVPRGSWHSTVAGSDTLSLNFTFTAPTWIDLLTAALRGRLAQSEDWRQTADGVSDPARFKTAQDKFNYLLSMLAEDIPEWNAIDILRATEADNFNKL